MLETLLGGLVGGILRLAPEAFKAFDRRNERKHELDLQSVALEFEKLRGAQKMAEIGAAADSAWNTGAMDAFAAAVKGQSKLTGVAWADALSSTIRPILTLSFFSLYAAVKLQTLWIVGPAAAWGLEDQALWSSICSFWFLGRVLEKR